MTRRREQELPDDIPEVVGDVGEGGLGDVDYEDLAADAEEKPDDLDRPPQPKSLTDIEGSQESMTDMQAIVKKAFPDVPDEDKSTRVVYHKKVLQNMQVARVYPEAFMSMIRLDVKRAYRFANKGKPFDVVAAVENAYTHISMGLEGRARIELAEFGGASREAQKQGNLGGLLGGGS